MQNKTAESKIRNKLKIVKFIKRVLHWRKTTNIGSKIRNFKKFVVKSSYVKFNFVYFQNVIWKYFDRASLLFFSFTNLFVLSKGKLYPPQIKL
jgi:hypothetical protein